MRTAGAISLAGLLCAPCRAASLPLCSGEFCLQFDSANQYARGVATYGETSIFPRATSGGFVAGSRNEQGTKFIGGPVQGGEVASAYYQVGDGAFFRSSLLETPDLDPVYKRSEWYEAIDGGIAVRQTVIPTSEAADFDVIYGLFVHVDAGFTDWAAFAPGGGLVQAIVADPAASSQRLGGSQDVAKIVAYNYDAQLTITWTPHFHDNADPYWFLAPQGDGRTTGHKLYARLDGYAGSTDAFAADWDVRVDPMPAAKSKSSAVPEPSSVLLLAAAAAGAVWHACRRARQESH